MSANRQEERVRNAAVGRQGEPLSADAFENAPNAMALIAADRCIIQANPPGGEAVLGEDHAAGPAITRAQGVAEAWGGSARNGWTEFGALNRI